MKYQKLSLGLVGFIFLFFLAACGEDDAVPTAVQPASIPDANPTVQLPATNAIATPVPDSTLVVETPVLNSGEIVTDDEFLPIDQILSEIDAEACQNAYETIAELEALMAEGDDLAELETAVEELIQELENCPTPTP